jgi:hypothetical protein
VKAVGRNPCNETIKPIVSSSVVASTVAYIGNQVEHHRKVTFAEEYKQFLQAYNTKYDERYLEND